MTICRYCSVWRIGDAFLHRCRCGSVQDGLVENPLRVGVEEGEKRLVDDLAVEPEVHAGDGRVF